MPLSPIPSAPNDGYSCYHAHLFFASRSCLPGSEVYATYISFVTLLVLFLKYFLCWLDKRQPCSKIQALQLCYVKGHSFKKGSQKIMISLEQGFQLHGASLSVVKIKQKLAANNSHLQKGLAAKLLSLPLPLLLRTLPETDLLYH